jgi:hypothetical protein
MKDMFTAKSRKLNKYGKAFECLPHQQGSLVFVNGEPVGFDVISREEAYAKLHPKLVKSYAMDALLQQEDRFTEPTAERARAFLKEAQECGDSKFPSVGQGFDYRFDGERMVGSALVFENCVIHLAFFRLDKVQRDEHIAGYRQRRGFRRRRT